jgi:hypothetical protein
VNTLADGFDFGGEVEEFAAIGLVDANLERLLELLRVDAVEFFPGEGLLVEELEGGEEKIGDVFVGAAVEMALEEGFEFGGEGDLHGLMACQGFSSVADSSEEKPCQRSRIVCEPIGHWGACEDDWWLLVA